MNPPAACRGVAAIVAATAFATSMFLTASRAQSQTVNATTTAFVEMAADGAHVRAIATTACPDAVIDNASRPMIVRAGATPAYPDVVCDLPLSASVRSVTIGGISLPLPHRVRRVVVIGDTGCRLKGAEVQACNDPHAWPFPTIARAVADAHPDLIIHVGDYYYRETACPAAFAGCTGTPHGDVQASWNADFFGPAAPIFTTAPLVLVRGNHEDCARGGVGWFRYLDTVLSTSCVPHTPPFAVALDGLHLVVFDDASADDASPNAQDVATLGAQLAAAHDLATGAPWLVMHRPPYGVTQRSDRDELVTLNATMQAASNGTTFAPYSAILAGHIHLFETLDLEGRPPVIINGMGGDRLDPLVTATVAGTAIGGIRVRNFTSQTRFGYAVYDRTRTGWTIAVHAPDGSVYETCALAQTIACR